MKVEVQPCWSDTDWLRLPASDVTTSKALIKLNVGFVLGWHNDLSLFTFLFFLKRKKLDNN